MVKLSESKKSSIEQGGEESRGRESVRLARKKKKLRKKMPVPKSRKRIAVGNVRLGTGKSVRKKVIKRVKKKAFGTLEETVLNEHQEDFWKSRNRTEEDSEESEDAAYGPREEEEFSPEEFYGGGSSQSKYESGGDAESFYQSRSLEVLQSGSEKKREFDSSGNIVRPKKEKFFSEGVVRGVVENPRDRMYFGEKESFEAEKLLTTPEKIHDYDEIKKYK